MCSSDLTDVLKILDSFGKEKSDGEESQIIDEKFDEEIIEVKYNTPIDIQNRAKINYSVLGKDARTIAARKTSPS